MMPQVTARVRRPPVIAVTGATGALGGRVAGPPVRRRRPPTCGSSSGTPSGHRSSPARRSARTPAAIPTPPASGRRWRAWTPSTSCRPPRPRTGCAQHVAAVDAAVDGRCAADRLHVLPRREPGRGLHPRPAARRHRGPDPRRPGSGRPSCGTPCTPTSSRSSPRPRTAARSSPPRPAQGRTSFVSRDDLADVAVAVLLDDTGRFDGQALEVTGPEALTMAEAAERARRGHRAARRLPRADRRGGVGDPPSLRASRTGRSRAG